MKYQIQSSMQRHLDWNKMYMYSSIGDSVHINPAVIDCVLPPAGRNHSPHLFGRSPSWKVPPLHHDSRHPLHLRYRGGSQHTFQVTGHAQNVPVGQKNISRGKIIL